MFFPSNNPDAFSPDITLCQSELHLRLRDEMSSKDKSKKECISKASKHSIPCFMMSFVSLFSAECTIRMVQGQAMELRC